MAVAVVGTYGFCEIRDEPPDQPRTAPIRASKPTPAHIGTRVHACLEVWEHIDYVAEGYEIDGLAPDDAMDTAIIMYTEVHGVTLDQLNDCLRLLEAAGY